MTNVHEDIVPEAFAVLKKPLVKGQEMARALNILQDVTKDTQAAFLGFVPGYLRLSCVQLNCAPMHTIELERKGWIPMCIHLIDGLVTGGAFIMDFDQLNMLQQGGLDRVSQKQLLAYYVEILAPLKDCEIRAKSVAAGQTILRALLNPVDLQQPAWIACQELEGKSRKLLQRFEVKAYTYHRLWPDATKCHPTERDTACKVMGRPIYTDLKIKLAIPAGLLSYRKPIALKPLVRFPGGGGTTEK